MKTKNKIITSLYDQYKNTNKKLKIVCDWDEVIQACEPHALSLAIGKELITSFESFFETFWEKKWIEYSPYGSKLVKSDIPLLKEQQEIKNSPNFYQTAPFLTIAEDLLRLIKEDKIERLIFLSAYDRRKFPNGDPRKRKIFEETFFKFSKFVPSGKTGKGGGEMMAYSYSVDERNIWLELIPFDSEMRSENTSIVGDQTQGQTKADWIKENASDFDIVIDDNPNICRSLVEFVKEVTARPSNYPIIAPYYPAIENQHDEEVVLVKNEVSNLKKEDFE